MGMSPFNRPLLIDRVKLQADKVTQKQSQSAPVSRTSLQHPRALIPELQPYASNRSLESGSWGRKLKHEVNPNSERPMCVIELLRRTALYLTDEPNDGLPDDTDAYSIA